MRQAISLVAPVLVFLFALGSASPVKNPGDDATCTDNIYVGTSNGQFQISEDGGQTWTNSAPVTIPTRNHFLYAAYAVGDNVYVGTGSGISISKDNGKTWTEQDISDGESDPSVRTIYAIGNRVYAGVNVKRLRISNDNGDTWPIDVELPDPYTVINYIYAVGNRTFVGTANGLGITDDDGQTWQYVDESPDTGSNDVNTVAGNGNYVYVGMEKDRGVVSISADLGQTWQTHYTTTLGRWNYVYSISATDTNVYAAVFGAGVSISADNGNSWNVKTVKDGLNSNEATRVSAVGDNVYVGTNYGLCISRNGGQTFTNAHTGPNQISALFAQCV